LLPAGVLDELKLSYVVSEARIHGILLIMHTKTWKFVEPYLHHVVHSKNGNFTVKMME
jgi:hypothetical protein